MYDENYEICGIDFSKSMVDIAKNKMPNARLIHYDFTNGLPQEFKKEKFDYIFSTYAIHHLDDNAKIRFITELLDCINIGGKLFIGDVAFEKYTQLEECKNSNQDDWDFDEFYPVFELFSDKFDNVSFYKASFCSGVITFAK